MINTQDMIAFYSASVTEFGLGIDQIRSLYYILRVEMQKALEIYFKVCEKQEEVPGKLAIC